MTPGNGRVLAVIGRYLLSSVSWRFGSLAILLGCWHVAALVSGGVMPGLTDGWREFQSLMNPTDLGFGLSRDSSVWTHLGHSAMRAYGALLISLALFTPLGMLIGSGRIVYQGSIGILEFGRSVPAFMFLLVLLSMRITGETARVTSIVLGTGAIICDYVASGVRNADKDRLEVLRLMRVGRFAAFWHSTWIPVLLDSLLPALRIGVGVSLILALVVETLTIPQSGLGVLLNASMGKVSLAGGLVLVFAAGFLGWIGNLAITLTSDALWWIYEGRPLPCSRRS